MDGTVLGSDIWIYGPQNLAYITVISMGKIYFAPLNILSSVYLA